MKALVLLPCFLLPAFLYSGESIQTDWSSGPGVTGPVTDWSDSFDLHQYMDYEGTTGELYLNLRGDKHQVTDLRGVLDLREWWLTSTVTVIST